MVCDNESSILFQTAKVLPCLLSPHPHVEVGRERHKQEVFVTRDMVPSVVGRPVMASRRSRSRNRSRSNLFSRFSGTIWIVVAAGVVAVWAGPGLPLVGTLVRGFRHGASEDKETDAISDDAQTDQLMDRRNQVSSVSMGMSRRAQTSGNVLPEEKRITAAIKPTDTIAIAGFNMQRFCESRPAEAWAVDIVAQMIRNFDVVAIQGIRCRSDEVVTQFVQAVNADGSRYTYVLGPRRGGPGDLERYGFLYETDHIEIDMTSSGTIQDPNDCLHHDPFVTRFRARTPDPDKSFTFWLINARIDPDNIVTEMNALADVFVVMQQARASEDDVIVVGDLSATSRQFGLLRRIPAITWIMNDVNTGIGGRGVYDNILFDRVVTAEYTGQGGVYDFEAAFRLSREQALAVSDHLPVWAEFDSREAPAGNAAQRPLQSIMR